MQTRCTTMLTMLVGGSLLVFSSGCGVHSSVPPRAPEAERVQLGYDSQDREDVTGSVSSITANDFREIRVGHIEQLLERVSGVQVVRRGNGDFTLRIRGARSLIGSNEPLVVINGSPVAAGLTAHTLMGINPGNVARIDILKDAGSTAAYGARGANGVIVITTKRAR
jgi:TonB-dependent starch-binding outer membrane protein SusC